MTTDRPLTLIGRPHRPTRRRRASPATPLTPTQQALVAQWVPFARRFAADLCQTNRRIRRIGLDEAFSAAMEGLVKAVPLHDPSRAAYSTYARWHMLSCILDAAQTLAAPFRLPAGDSRHTPETAALLRFAWRTPLSPWGRNWHPFDLAVSRDDKTHRTSDREEAMGRAFALLSDDHKRILWDHYCEGLTAREIGRAEGVCKQSIRGRINTAKKHLRRLVLEIMEGLTNADR